MADADQANNDPEATATAAGRAAHFAGAHANSRADDRADERAARKRRLARIRRSILRGEYENALKISVAADRLLDKLTDPR